MVAVVARLVFAKDTALDILLGALEVLNEESEPLGLRVSWVKTKIQAFNDILDAAILSVPVLVRMLRSRRDSLPRGDAALSAGQGFCSNNY